MVYSKPGEPGRPGMWERDEMVTLCVRAHCFSEMRIFIERAPFFDFRIRPEQLIKENYLAIIRSGCVSVELIPNKSLSLQQALIESSQITIQSEACNNTCRLVKHIFQTSELQPWPKEYLRNISCNQADLRQHTLLLAEESMSL